MAVGGDVSTFLTFIAMGFSSAGQVLITKLIGLAILFGPVLDMKHYGFWLGDALAGFTPFWIGVVFYFSGLRKRGKPAKSH